MLMGAGAGSTGSGAGSGIMRLPTWRSIALQCWRSTLSIQGGLGIGCRTDRWYHPAMEIKVDRRFGYVLRAFVWKGRIDQARSFARGVRRTVEVVEDTGSDLKLFASLLFKPGKKKGR